MAHFDCVELRTFGDVLLPYVSTLHAKCQSARVCKGL